MKIFYMVLPVIVLGLLFIIVYFRSNRAEDETAAGIQLPDASNVKAMTFDSTPDSPIGFGYKCQWFAIKTTDTQAVAQAMQLKNVQAANWSTGIDGSDEGYYFVTPQVKGWTLVVNSIMPDLSGIEAPNPLDVISGLSSKFGEAYYFGTHRIVDYHAWAKSVNGKLIRAYGFLGESGETMINEGELSNAERDNHLIFTELDSEEPHLPSEEDVLLIAKEWTIDPLMEEGHGETGTGLVGTLK